VGRVASPPGTVLIYLETHDGPEYLFVSQQPGTELSVMLPTGTSLTSDALAVRLSDSELVLAGGTFARTGDRLVRQTRSSGVIRRAVRQTLIGGRGWFETEEPLADPESLKGRILLIRHGDGTTRGWTIVQANNSPGGHARLIVREEPGYRLEGRDQEAHYYQFPGISAPPPHRFYVSKIQRKTQLGTGVEEDLKKFR
jgi:hypothetical protein